MTLPSGGKDHDKGKQRTTFLFNNVSWLILSGSSLPRVMYISLWYYMKHYWIRKRTTISTLSKPFFTMNRPPGRGKSRMTASNRRRGRGRGGMYSSRDVRQWVNKKWIGPHLPAGTSGPNTQQGTGSCLVGGIFASHIFLYFDRWTFHQHPRELFTSWVKMYRKKWPAKIPPEQLSLPC